MTNIFHAQCTTLEAALRSLPYVSFVDALPTQTKPDETTIVLDTHSELLTLSHLCEILGLIREHLGDQKFFDIEVGRSTVCISGIKSVPKLNLGQVYATKGT